jgi:hypothetical protein
MSNYNQLLNSGIQAVDNYYIDITTGASNENTELLGINNKNSVLFEKQKIQMQLLEEIENKEKLLLTRSRMLQISHDRNSYKKQLIYTTFACAIALSILIIIIFGIVRKYKVQ